MDEAEKNRLREYIKSKQVKPEKMTPEREAEFAKIIEGYAAQLKVTKTGPNDYVISKRDVETGLKAVPLGDSKGIIFAGLLTMSVLMTLPDDAFILSNPSKDDGSPVLVQQVGDQTKRGDVWQKLRTMRLDGRRFYIFSDEEAVDRFLARRAEAYKRNSE